MADKTEGNVFGPWDPSSFDVEDSAFGFIKMENGATIYLEASWILNSTDTREAATTLCGTEGGVEMKGLDPDSYEIVFNSAKYGRLLEERLSNLGSIAFFEAFEESIAEKEARQWLNSIINDTEPLVKPEQSLVVTQILEAIYLSAKTGKMIEL
jgi:predicted dehydrogenase